MEKRESKLFTYTVVIETPWRNDTAQSIAHDIIGRLSTMGLREVEIEVHSE